MDAIPEITVLSGTKAPQVRPALTLLKASRRSVNEVLEAVQLVETRRRSANANTKGRMSRVEVDLLRATVVLTSSGLDATMKRLVLDSVRHLINVPGTGARARYVEYLKNELSKNQVSAPLKDAVTSGDPGSDLLELYLSERTKASFQGSGDLKKRVRNLLGIPQARIDDSLLESLDSFFRMRNQIVHQMDFQDLTSGSSARIHRRKDSTIDECANVFRISAEILVATQNVVH